LSGGWIDGAREASFAGLDVVRDLGYAGVKLHPRICAWEPTAETLGEVFALAAERGLVVFYCSAPAAPLAPGKTTPTLQRGGFR
jgi:hypothetical protein